MQFLTYFVSIFEIVSIGIIHGLLQKVVSKRTQNRSHTKKISDMVTFELFQTCHFGVVGDYPLGLHLWLKTRVTLVNFELFFKSCQLCHFCPVVSVCQFQSFWC